MALKNGVKSLKEKRELARFLKNLEATNAKHPVGVEDGVVYAYNPKTGEYEEEHDVVEDIAEMMENKEAPKNEECEGEDE